RSGRIESAPLWIDVEASTLVEALLDPCKSRRRLPSWTLRRCTLSSIDFSAHVCARSVLPGGTCTPSPTADPKIQHGGSPTSVQVPCGRVSAGEWRRGPNRWLPAG